MAVEEWRPVAGFEGVYEVSSTGRVRSLARRDSRGNRLPEKILKPWVGSDPRLHVTLYNNGTAAKRKVHALVAEAFLGERPAGMEVCHWDDNPVNNNATNLRYGTRGDNMRDRVRNGGHHQARKTHCSRGHLLQAPNLRPDVAARGQRNCLACTRAQHIPASNPSLRQRVADEKYADIIGKVVAA